MYIWEATIISILIAWNIIVFLLYGADKRRAKTGRWRISENALLFSALIMGGIGALLGMKMFRHKTKHIKFQIAVPLAVAINIAVVAAVILRYFSPSI